ncbi:amino acid ABC transporter substrate-binding protein [Reyranella sp.]|uniref:amino acid ABC transporter substrate-binding protein n=1 Tax=Reyranella sp. TaxID=1929291 RepID=UPI0025E585D2|nr:amino acid ABC transporter substrate-binding protein [Reyranella sp.]
MKRFVSGLAPTLALAMGFLVAGSAWAGTLDDIAKNGVIRGGFRENAHPFAYKGPNGKPSGFMVQLCEAVAGDIAKQLKLPGLKVEFVPVTTENRLDMIKQGKIDLLCDSLTETLDRRAVVDFSITTFVDGTSFAIRNDGPRDMQDLAGKKVGAVAGTLTEEELRKALASIHVAATVVPFTDFTAAMTALEKGEISAYFAGGAMLTAMIKDHKDASRILLANTYLSLEPFALAMKLGEGPFRLAVDRALSHIYRSGQIATIFGDVFGKNARPTQQLQTLYMIATLPE